MRSTQPPPPPYLAAPEKVLLMGTRRLGVGGQVIETLGERVVGLSSRPYNDCSTVQTVTHMLADALPVVDMSICFVRA